MPATSSRPSYGNVALRYCSLSLPGTHSQSLLLIGASVLRLRDAFSDGRDLGGNGVRVHGRDVEGLQRRRKDSHREEDVENLGELHLDCRRMAAGEKRARELGGNDCREQTNAGTMETRRSDSSTNFAERDGKLRWRTEVVFHIVHVSGASSILMGEPLPLSQPEKDAVTTDRTSAVRSPSQALPTKIGRSVSELSSHECASQPTSHSLVMQPSACSSCASSRQRRLKQGTILEVP